MDSKIFVCVCVLNDLIGYGDGRYGRDVFSRGVEVHDLCFFNI